MLNDEELERIFNLRGFKTNVHLLMRFFNINSNDAGILLLEELISNRLKNINDLSSVSDEILQWRITYAKKDIIRKDLKSKERIKNIRYNLAVLNSDYNYNSIDLSMDDLNVIFPKFKDKTKEFIYFLLQHGMEETLEQFRLNKTQLMQKIQYIKRCTKGNQDDLYKYLSSKDKRLELNIVNQFIKSIEDLNYSDDEFKLLIIQHKDYVSDIISKSKTIKHQRKLIKDWDNLPRVEQYAFINLLYIRRNIIEGTLLQPPKM